VGQEVETTARRHAAEAVLRVEDVTVRFGGVTALDGPSFAVPAGSVCGLIGPNGAGKTTLFNCVSRLYTPVAGSISYQGDELLAMPAHRIAPLGIARTFQNVGLVPSLSVRENVMVGAHHRMRATFATAALRLPAVRREERERADEADDALARLDLLDVADRPAAGLPYGTLKRVELARALCGRPSLLLLDEPASGLNHAEVGELAELLLELRNEYDLTVLLVEHHMGMVMRICDHVVVLNFGRLIAQGAPEEVRRDEAVVEAYLGTGE
jgi:branched-chain amino acid transport system ATP-binding protein